MKKNLMLVLISVFMLGGAVAQSGYNLFDAADVDADGWLWLDTQAKIDKYVGQANNTIGAYQTDGKIIQLVSMDYTVKVPDPDGFPGDSIQVTRPTFVGLDTIGAAKDPVEVTDDDGKTSNTYPLNGPGAKRGAIVLTRASVSGKSDGGGIVIKLPPIVKYELYLSSEDRMLTNTLLTTDEAARFSEYGAVRGYIAPFSYLQRTGGHKEWNIGAETNRNTGLAVTADATQYVLCRNTWLLPLYVHGIRVLTKAPTSVNNVYGNAFEVYYNGSAVVCNNEHAEITLVDALGKTVAQGKGAQLPLPKMAPGVYIAKVQVDARVQTSKITVR